jgi:hypothetical protein
MPVVLESTQNDHREAVTVSNKLHCKKWFSIFPSPAGISLTKLSLAGNNCPANYWLVVTSPLETGKIIDLFLQFNGRWKGGGVSM